MPEPRSTSRPERPRSAMKWRLSCRPGASASLFLPTCPPRTAVGAWPNSWPPGRTGSTSSSTTPGPPGVPPSNPSTRQRGNGCWPSTSKVSFTPPNSSSLCSKHRGVQRSRPGSSTSVPSMGFRSRRWRRTPTRRQRRPCTNSPAIWPKDWPRPSPSMPSHRDRSNRR